MDVDRCMPTLMVALLAPKRLRKAPVKQFLQPSDEEVLGYDEDEIEDGQDSQLDITLDDSINRCFQTIEQNFGKFDILINNAGTAGRDLPPDQRSLRQLFDHCFTIQCHLGCRPDRDDGAAAGEVDASESHLHLVVPRQYCARAQAEYRSSCLCYFTTQASWP
jgi:NAD(P)-dependent dehydrogenase (short-subunit alcohol dehydrogenase family)